MVEPELVRLPYQLPLLQFVIPSALSKVAYNKRIAAGEFPLYHLTDFVAPRGFESLYRKLFTIRLRGCFMHKRAVLRLLAEKREKQASR